jgi:HK97 family phage major capsid protein
MKISEQIAALLKSRGAVVERMEALHKSMVTGDVIRSFTEDEQKKYDEDKKAVDAIDKQLVQLREMEKLLATQAAPVIPAPGHPAPTPGVAVVPFKQAFAGQSFTRYVGCLARAKGNLVQAAANAERYKDQTPEVVEVLKAAVAAGTTTDVNWAAPLVAYNQMASEFIDFLRPKTILGQITGFRNVPFAIKIPRQTAGATANWVGEGLSKKVSKLQFDNVTLPFAKIAVIAVITEELARLSTPSAEQLVRDDLAQAVIQFMDTQFSDPAVAASAGVRPGSITNGIVGIPSTGNTVAAVTDDLKAALLATTVANIPMNAPYWLMHPSVYMFLSLLRTAQDLFAFRDEMVGSKKLLGVPFVVSNNVDNDSLILFDASEILLADDGQVMIDASSEATLQLDDAPATPPTPLVSLWQQNMLGIKAERYVYWMRRRDDAVQMITGFPLTPP